MLLIVPNIYNQLQITTNLYLPHVDLATFMTAVCCQSQTKLHSFLSETSQFDNCPKACPVNVQSSF